LTDVISAEATIGILGGGQLGRFLAVEAVAAGYRVVVRTDDAPGGPAAQVAHAEIVGSYDDADANHRFAASCDVITSEFENLPVTLLDSLAEMVPVRPASSSIGVCQHRRREKEFLALHGVPHARFVVVRSSTELSAALGAVGGSGILKTASFGYDGRGQIRLDRVSNLDDAWALLGVPEAVLEQLVPFVQEISVVGARGVDGSWVSFPPGENVHANGILDFTVAPARVLSEIATRADELAHRLADALDHVGTIGVEFFVLADGSLVVNEMAPRPHNSGHHTMDACVTSQFGLQLQAVTGTRFGSVHQHTSAVMVNLLGDIWVNGEPDWSAVSRVPNARLHLYGKSAPKPGRKMGHLTMLANGQPIDGVITDALRLRTTLRGDDRETVKP
jgi:5-(carboxyamino)imidazole ribonucleotide synthase